MPPQMQRPAPRAMTRVWSTSTALLKKSIFLFAGIASLVMFFLFGNSKAGMSRLLCAAVDSGFSFQVFGCAFLRLCVSLVSLALSASSFTEWVSDLYIKICQIRRILNLRPRPRQRPQIPPPASAWALWRGIFQCQRRSWDSRPKDTCSWGVLWCRITSYYNCFLKCRKQTQKSRKSLSSLTASCAAMMGGDYLTVIDRDRKGCASEV